MSQRRRRKQRAKAILERVPYAAELLQAYLEKEPEKEPKEAAEDLARGLAPTDYGQWVWWCPECERSIMDNEVILDEKDPEVRYCPNCLSRLRRKRIGHIIRDYILDAWVEVRRHGLL